MKNTVKYKGKYLNSFAVPERKEFVTRMYSDASFNNQTQNSQELDLIGYGYCVKLPDYGMKKSIPAYGYGVVQQNISRNSTTAELLGIIHAFQDTGLSRDIEIVCDNYDAVNIINHLSVGHELRYFHVPNSLQVVLEEIEPLLDGTISARWVKGHNSDEYNNTVNMLARLARKTHGSQINTQRVANYESNAIAYFRRQ